MSWRVANLCAERKFGSPVRKQIIMFLADKASDDGSGIWCSKGTIQRHTELGETTVKRTINEFLLEGIIVQTGKRRCANGYTVVYRIQLNCINELESIREPEFDAEFSTGSIEDGVCQEPGTRSTVDWVLGPVRPPNHPKTIQKPSTGARALGPDGFDDLWNEWPAKDRPKKRIAAKYSFDRLSATDQQQAIRFAESFRKLCKQKDSAPLMIPYLKDRSFSELADGPEIDGEGRFVFTPEREEWPAWVGYLKSKYSVKAAEHIEAQGKFVDARRWPPAIEGARHEG